jgi:hypothetical protein
LWRSKTFVIGAAIVLFWVLDAIFWPLFVPYDPEGLVSPMTLQPPSAEHLFGTDDLATSSRAPSPARGRRSPLRHSPRRSGSPAGSSSGFSPAITEESPTTS